MTVRRISYEEFAEHLPEVLDDIARTQETVLVEKHGQIFRIEQAAEASESRLPPTPPPDVVRRILRETAGGFHTPNREAFLKELRDSRGQDSKGRPA